MPQITLIVYDENFDPVAEIDTAEVLWVSRYDTTGEFTIKTQADSDTIGLYRPGRLIQKAPIEAWGVIEKLTIDMTQDGQQILTVSGRTADCIMERRVWESVDNANVSDIGQAISDIVGHFTGTRALHVTVDTSEADSLTIESFVQERRGKSLLYLTQEVVQAGECGYSFTYDRSTKKFILKPYKGQNDTDVIFSPEFDTVKSAQYINDRQGIITHAYIAGEGEDEERVITEIDTGQAGLERYESWIDARDLQKGKATDSQYLSLLKQRGMEKIAESTFTEAFAGEVVQVSTQWVYGKDYMLGDRVMVEVKNWGITAWYRITELTEQQNSAGYQCQPTFAK